MEFLNQFLPILLYIAGLVLLIALVVLVIKLIKVVDKADRIADNVEDKINSFNGSIELLSRAAEGVASISDSFVFGITSAISKIFGKIKKNKEDEILWVIKRDLDLVSLF